MSNNSKNDNLLRYLAIGGALGISYLLVNYLAKRKNLSAKPLDLEKTRKMLQQIKFQMLTTCIAFVEGLKLKSKGAQSSQDLEIFYRTEIAKIFETREETIINKYMAGKEEYAVSLEKYSRDQKIKNGQREIFDMMERAIAGNIPDLTVPKEAKAVLNNKQIVAVYLEMCELIAVKLWEKLDECKRDNPGFNSKDETHYRKAIRELGIYDLKVELLERKGFRPVWGCPNQIFYKVMESVKQQNKEVKASITAIEKAYEYAVERVTNEPEHLNAERVKFLIDEKVNPKPAEPIRPPVPVNVVQSQPVSSNKPLAASKNMKPAPVAKKEEDYDLDALMLNQLMSRSSQPPKEVKKQQPVQRQAPKVEQPVKKAQVQAPVEIPAPVAPPAVPAEVPVVPAELPAEVPAVIPVEVPAVAPVEVPAVAPVEVPAEIPAVVQVQVAAEVPEVVQAQAPVEVPVVVEAEIPAVVQAQIPAQVPQVVPVVIPEQAPLVPAAQPVVEIPVVQADNEVRAQVPAESQQQVAVDNQNEHAVIESIVQENRPSQQIVIDNSNEINVEANIESSIAEPEAINIKKEEIHQQPIEQQNRE